MPEIEESHQNETSCSYLKSGYCELKATNYLTFGQPVGQQPDMT